MSKKNKGIYWVATVWLALGTVWSAVVQLSGLEEEKQMMARLGYPGYFLIIIGVWKLLGILAILLPRTPLLKEWAYAGLFFMMSGAILSHIAVNDPAVELFGPVLLLLLTTI